MGDKSKGLYGKYAVYKITDRDHEGDPADAELVTDFCFVLRPETDPIAKDALKLYAAMAALAGYEKLANDLLDVVDGIEHPLHFQQPKIENSDVKPGRLDVRPKEYTRCGLSRCGERIWRVAGETYWRHEDEEAAAIKAGGEHEPSPIRRGIRGTEEINLPEEEVPHQDKLT